MMGNAHPNLAPYAVFDCADGWIILATGNDAQYQRLCAVLGLAEMASDRRLSATNADRIANRVEMTARLTAATRRLDQSRPAGRLRGGRRARRADQRSGRGFRRPAGHRAGMQIAPDGVPGVRSPMTFSGAELALDRPAPTLGRTTSPGSLTETGQDPRQIRPISPAVPPGARRSNRARDGHGGSGLSVRSHAHGFHKFRVLHM